jgi:tetratricopeptide (TPR) repeat protein
VRLLSSLTSAFAFRLAITAFVVAGCKTTAAKSEPPKAAPASEKAPTAPAVVDPKLLALADVSGRTPAELRVRELTQALRRRMDWDDGWLLLGRAWVRRAREAADPGYYLHADACAQVLLARSPAHAGALNLRGLVLLNQHEFRAAKAVAESILERDAFDVMAWGTLSDAELELGDFDAAVAATDRMMAAKPGLPSYTRSSYLRFLRGDSAGAIQAIRVAIDAGLDPNDGEPLAWTLVQAARLFWHEGDYAGADAGFEQALQVVPDYAPALVERARIALGLGEASRAAALLSRAAKKSPLVETLWLLGDALTAAGDEPGAAQAYTRAEREGLRGDRRTLSLMDSARNVNVARALELARAEFALRRDIYTEDALAWALYRNRQFAAARRHIDSACRLGTRDASLLYHRGSILIANGDALEGQKLLRKALALNPKFDRLAAREAAHLLARNTHAK